VFTVMLFTGLQIFFKPDKKLQACQTPEQEQNLGQPLFFMVMLCKQETITEVGIIFGEEWLLL
jgi:hypothetical protein